MRLEPDSVSAREWRAKDIDMSPQRAQRTQQGETAGNRTGCEIRGMEITGISANAKAQSRNRWNSTMDEHG
jgi:hypothetical protein